MPTHARRPGRPRAAVLVGPTLILTILLAPPAAARPAGEALRAILAPLGSDLVTTGRLLDRTLPLAGLPALDGGREAPAATPERLRQAVDELRLAAVDAGGWPAGWPDAAALRERTRANRAAIQRAAWRPDTSPLHEIALVDLPWQSLRPGALQDGLLALGEDRATLAPAAGVAAADLLREGRATAAAALVPATFHGARVRFVIPADLVLADGPAGGPLDLAIDLDDGLGLRAIAVDRPVAAGYAATGRKEVRLRLAARGGEVRWARFAFDVAALDTPPPTEVWPLVAGIAFEGLAAAGEAYVYLADGHAGVVSPVVVVEGFDLDDSYGWPELYALLNQENLLEDLRAAGRDAVVLNFASATDPIQRNAFLLVELLQTLSARMPARAAFPVIGASMGGLVARHALAWLETEGGGHACDLFVSFDAPHAGADIPLGLQCWVAFFADESDEAAYLLSRLDTPAARQMLLYHHAAQSGSAAAPDPLFAQLQADLDALGGWPAQPRLVAVANGSGQGLDQGFAPGDQLISYEYESFLVDIVGNVWAVPDGGPQVVFHGLIDQIWPFPDRQRVVTVDGALPWDGAPGGHRASLAQMDTTEVPYGDIVALHDRHAFIPTVSALAIAGADPFADLQTPSAFPPFDAAYLPAENQEHVTITPESRAWLLDEILNPAAAVAGEPPPASGVLRLAGARPNPFNPRTEIRFALPRDGEVGLWIVDPRGRRLRRLVERELPAGSHTAVWDGRDQDGVAAAAGVYLAVLEHGGSRIARRLTLVR